MRPQGGTPASFQAPPAEADPMRPTGATPTFGAFDQLQSATSETDRLIKTLVSQGFDQNVARQTVGMYFGVNPMTGQRAA